MANRVAEKIWNVYLNTKKVNSNILNNVEILIALFHMCWMLFSFYDTKKKRKLYTLCASVVWCTILNNMICIYVHRNNNKMKQ